MHPEPVSIPVAREDRRAATVLFRLPKGRSHLGAALAISTCLHGLVLYWSWRVPPTPAPVAATMEVVLVNAETLSPPVHPTVVAQQALDGGGDAHSGIAASPLPRTVLRSPDEQVLLALQKRQAELEARQQELLTQLAHDPHGLRSESLPQPEQSGDAAIERDSQIISARIAALKARIDADNAQPQRQFAGPAAARAAYAAYVEAWRLRMEQLGTAHYPAEARGRIYGSLQLSVHIRRDGSLERVHIDRPSEHAVLNLAARRIVQLAAPFAPLPEDVVRDADGLTITRTWHFTDERLDTAP